MGKALAGPPEYTHPINTPEERENTNFSLVNHHTGVLKDKWWHYSYRRASMLETALPILNTA